MPYSEELDSKLARRLCEVVAGKIKELVSLEAIIRLASD